MGKPPPITIPTEPVGSIPRRVDLIEQVSRGENEPINLSYLRKGLRLSARALPDPLHRQDTGASAGRNSP